MFKGFWGIFGAFGYILEIKKPLKIQRLFVACSNAVYSSIKSLITRIRTNSKAIPKITLMT
jgi:hypothetical protein|tara:strand:+ start:406 stop:588 length:183 start_codon:yes stop_codon:yes gene_type:complete